MVLFRSACPPSSPASSCHPSGSDAAEEANEQSYGRGKAGPGEKIGGFPLSERLETVISPSGTGVCGPSAPSTLSWNGHFPSPR